MSAYFVYGFIISLNKINFLIFQKSKKRSLGSFKGNFEIRPDISQILPSDLINMKLKEILLTPTHYNM
jgi:hypothetical protein